MDLQEYNKVKELKYLEYCDYLQKKYGIGKCDYMTKSWNLNPKCKRTSEGLVAHHKYEDHAIMLSTKMFAMLNPFEWQKAENIVYCDYIEHLFLHILICENPSKEKNRNESRIRYLERMIRTCEIVEDHSDADQVGLNKTVTLYFEEDDETDKFSFVTTVLVDTMQNRVSIESPLGKALLGHKKGERVYIPVNPQYGYYVEIKEIEPFNEDIPLNQY